MEIIIVIFLLILVTETTYLVAVNTKRLSHKKEIKPIFVDTSVLIDGRIVSVAKSGFIQGKLSIPRSVIGELQFLADNADNEKRSRARFGLDVVTELQAMDNVNVEIFQDGSKADEGVDERLLNLAKKYKGLICTIDYNLNKVAKVENIEVLNVNDLAMNLRMSHLPGEKMLLELNQKGQDGHQAVGHLIDGTMVVVEHASSQIGKTAEIEFVRSLQTAAGKMMFARLVDAKKESTTSKRQTNSGRKPVEKVKKIEAKAKSVDKPKQQQARKQSKSKSQTQPQNKSQPQPQKKSPQKPQTTVFHSDSNDQRLANKQKHNNKPRKQKNKSDQREQDFIDLLNEQ